MQEFSKFSIRQRLSLLGALAAVFLSVFVLRLAAPGFFRILDLKLADQFFQLRLAIRGVEKIDPVIVHVDLDDSSLEALRISEFDRSVYARVVNVLQRAGAQGIIFDNLFTSQRDGATDASFARAVSNSGRVFLAVSAQSADSRGANIAPPPDSTVWQPKILNQGNPPAAVAVIGNYPDLSASCRGTGHISIDPDEDGVFRRIPLLYRYGQGYIPALVLKAAMSLFQVSETDITVRFGSEIVLPAAKLPGGVARDIRIPVDRTGSMIVNFPGTWRKSFRHYSFQGILRAETDPTVRNALLDDLEGALVIVSDITTRGKDHGTVPLEKVYPKPGLHSSFLNSILTDSFIRLPHPAILALANVAVILLLWFFALGGNALVFAGLSAGLLVLLSAGSFFLFFGFNLLVPPAYTLISFILSLPAAILAQHLAQQKNYIGHILELNEAATRFVPRDFLNHLGRGDITKIELGDQVHREMSILFSDIRSFTTLSEKMTPQENFNFINSYLREMGPIIRQHNGFIDKYIGDAIMALFAGKPDDAVLAAVKMKEQLLGYNARRAAGGQPPLSIGVGVNTGDLMLGIIGENRRFDSTVISDSVNLASRLESLTKHYGAGTVISEFTLARLQNPSAFRVRFLDRVKVKGKKAPVSIYEVLDGESPENVTMKSASMDRFDEAYRLYLAKDFQSACRIYQELCVAYPEDKLGGIFRSRCEHLAKNGVPDGWDGTAVLTEK